MHQKSRSRKIIMHIICIAGAALLTGLAFIINASTVPSEIKSYYREDMELADDSISVYSESDLSIEYGILMGDRVLPKRAAARLFVDFPGEMTSNLRTVTVKFRKAFSHDITVYLYYQDKNGKYDNDHFVSYGLAEGETVAYFSLPKKVKYEMTGLRLDIAESCYIDDIIISQKEYNSYYYPEEHFLIRPMIIFFIMALILLELICFLIPEIIAFFRWIRKEWKSILKMCGLMAGSAILCNLAGILIFRFMHKEYDWFWVIMFAITGMILSIEIFYLIKKLPENKIAAKVSVTNTGNGSNELITMILFWGIVAAFSLIVLYSLYNSLNHTSGVLDKARIIMPFALMFSQVILLALLFNKYVLGRNEDLISFKKIYLLLLFLMALGYLMVFLPYVSPDEFSHYLSAYRVSNALIGQIGQLGDRRLLMRAEDYILYDTRRLVLSPAYYMQTTENVHLLLWDRSYVICDAPMVTNAIFSYLPTGIGIAVGRLFGLSAIVTYYLGRMANLLFYILVMKHLMEKIPFGRPALFAISMMPMTLSLVGSYNYDVATFCFVSLFVAQVLCMVSQKEEITKRDYQMCILYAMLMAPSKLVYVPLLLLVFMIPGYKLSQNRSQASWMKWKIVLLGLLSLVVITMAVNLLGSDSAIREMVKDSASTGNYVAWAGEEGYTISWLLAHPIKYIVMCARTLLTMSDYYFFTLLGSKLGWLDIDIPQILVVFSFIMVILCINIRDEASDSVSISLIQKVIIAVLCGASVMVTFLAMALDWTPLSYNYIVGVQGRYFIPLLLPVIWLLRNPMIRVRSAIRKRIVFFETLLNMYIMIYVMVHCIFVE